jgi:hypothetical protein
VTAICVWKAVEFVAEMAAPDSYGTQWAPDAVQSKECVWKREREADREGEKPFLRRKGAWE